nr:P-II family nitrogen regulator [uncultured Methanoregula sp.]
MKQIIAILREEQVENTKQSLLAIGIMGVTFLYVTGRGQQKGRVSARELGTSLTRNMRMQLVNAPSWNGAPDAGAGITGSAGHPDTEFSFGFLPKRMLIIVAYDEDVSRIVQAIVDANQTGRHGDGRIFICPMISAMRVRTGELGDLALS